jgi:hypothetical protein
MNNIDVSWKSHSIEELNVQKHTIQFLQKCGVATLYELFHKTEDDFMRMRIVSGSGFARFLRRKELHEILVSRDECLNASLSKRSLALPS